MRISGKASSGIAVILLISSLATLVPSVAFSAVGKPVVVSVLVTPKTLPALGGTVRIAVASRFASNCDISIVPAIAGHSHAFPCASGHLVTAVTIGKNTNPLGRTISFRVYVTGKGGRSVLKIAIVSQATDIGPLGATLDVHDFNGNTLAATVTKIVDPATGMDQFSQPNLGFRFVAVQMNLQSAAQKTISNNSNIDTTVIGTDNQGYSPDFNSVAECTNFNSGEFTLLPGYSETGCVVFQLPNGINVKTVQFSFDSMFLDTAQWNM